MGRLGEVHFESRTSCETELHPLVDEKHLHDGEVERLHCYQKVEQLRRKVKEQRRCKESEMIRQKCADAAFQRLEAQCRPGQHEVADCTPWAESSSRRETFFERCIYYISSAWLACLIGKPGSFDFKIAWFVLLSRLARQSLYSKCIF